MNNKIWKFQEEKNARGFWNQTIKMHCIILGDDGKFWVVTMAQGEAMRNAGYEDITLS